ncbi:TPA: hypothetical protein RPW20_000683 [Campylobacter fetus subsp. venerealis]|nr:hypothetical protein [Campylobacter fetus subsp. venerealis]HDX6324038.1 hypothetical protein [Campylobacter fetus subsp. venerealis]
MASKGLNQNALNAIMANSELKEGKVTPVVGEEPKKRKIFQSFTLNLEVNEYQRLQEYVKSNEVKSTNALIRSLLVEKGII